ncbi:MAG TPA: DUF4229 domain-containing protein [Streptosporangiaceae bacterium]|jgi:hypothetical protein
MRAVLIYTLSRLALFAATFGVLYLLGARGALALLLALLISGLVAFVLLSRQRDNLSGAVTGLARRSREFGKRLDEGAAAEDDDAPESSGTPPRPSAS